MNIKKTKKRVKPIEKPAILQPKPKANKYKKRKVGRPRFKIDFDMVEKLAQIHCTQEEIAHFLGCSVDTLQRNSEFSGIHKKGLDLGRMSLRRQQWKLVEAGNCAMTIFLGKNILNQSDTPMDMSKQMVAQPVQIILATDEKPKIHIRNSDDDDNPPPTLTEKLK